MSVKINLALCYLLLGCLFLAPVVAFGVKMEHAAVRSIAEDRQQQSQRYFTITCNGATVDARKYTVKDGCLTVQKTDILTPGFKIPDDCPSISFLGATVLEHTGVKAGKTHASGAEGI